MPTAIAPVVSTPPTTAKLPKLNLKHFNGSLVGWSPFWDSYKATVHDNPDLSDARKFAYLQSVLEGKAHDAIAGLPITDANYDVAIRLLKDRFGDREQTIDAHMERLMKLEPVRSETHVVELRRLYDKAESTIRSLEALGVALDSYGALLTPVFVPKLPDELRLEITRKVPKAEWNMTKILKVLHEELEARERAVGHGSRGNQMPVGKRGKEYPTTKTFFSGGESGCCYCGEEGHAPVNCKKVVSVEDRKHVIKESKRCFNCLKRGHVGKDCRSSSKCASCKGRHHTSICMNKPKHNTTPSVPSSSPKPSQATPPAPVQVGGLGVMNPNLPVFQPTTTCYVSTCNTVFLQTAKAPAFNVEQPHKKMNAQLLLDSGSQCSYITERACKKLALKPLGTKSVSILTFGSREESRKDCKVVRLGIELKNGINLELKLLSVAHICEPIINAAVDLAQYPYLQSLEFANDWSNSSQISPDVLLGSDQYWSLLTGETVRGENGPVAINTHVGWILSGPAITKDVGEQSATLVTHVLRVDGGTECRNLEKELHSFWSTESLGIVDNELVVQSQFEDNVTFESGRYVVSLPWKESCLTLPDNFKLSLRRLNSLFRRMKDSPEILEKYDAVIQEQLAMGIVVPVNEQEECTSRIHYLPHHGVIRKDKDTTKLRIVYDASAKTEGPSLNNCLHIGPSLHQKIFDILVRFRVYPIAIVADIEKAFLMIKVANEDQDVLRFLWFRDIHADSPEVQAYKFTRVVFGVSPSPYLLNATISQHLKQFEDTRPKTVQKIKESIYVDDVITGVFTVDEAFEFYEESQEIFKEGGFNLRKFSSNCKVLQDRIDEAENQNESSPTEESYAQATLGGVNKALKGEQKVLGVIWDIERDEFVVNVESILEEALKTEPTKRNIIRIVSKIYDPMGLISPVIIQFKIFFQELCQSKISWDEPLTEVLRERWKRLLSGLRVKDSIRAPRRFFSEFNEPAQLIGFCDASVRAYAASVYLQNGNKECSLIASKTRVAPLPAQTIPRLELLGALLLARLVVSVRNALGSIVSGYECFTDSLVVLHWIKGKDKAWKPYVQNRVREIREGVPSEHWSHCRGVDNPADIPSSGITLQALVESQLWFHGPNWLRDSNINIEGDTLGASMPTECLEELRVKDRETLALSVVENNKGDISDIMSIERFSSYNKLIGSTAYVLKFVERLKKLRNVNSLVPVVNSFVPVVNSSVPVVNSSVPVVDSSVPVVNSSVPVANSSVPVANSSVPVANSSVPVVNSFVPVANSSVPVANSSVPVANSSVPVVNSFVPVANSSVPVVNSFVPVANSSVPVANSSVPVVNSFVPVVNSSVPEVNSFVPVVNSSVPVVNSSVPEVNSFVPVVNSSVPVVNSSVPEVNSFVPVVNSSVPVVNSSVPEVNSSVPVVDSSVPVVDLSVPVVNTLVPVVSSSSVLNNSFDSLRSRAVHFELVTDLSPYSFLGCLKRFVCRRGLPSIVVSDNGSTFKAAAKEIKRIMSHPTVKQYLSSTNIQWRFNIERAPWWGGFFERMVQLLKTMFTKISW